MRFAALLGVAAAVSYGALIYLIVRDGGALTGPDVALDLRFLGYSADDARAWLDGMTEVQRETYFGAIGLVDTIFPVLFGAALSVFLWQLGGKWTIALPVAYSAFDLLENATIRSLPDVSDFTETAEWASTMTVCKFSALGLTLLALIWAFKTRKVL